MRMSLTNDPPFALGQTLGVSSTADGKGWVGAVKTFPDVNPTTGAVRSNRMKTCVAVRNTSGGAILPKRVVRFAHGTAGTALFSTVNGYVAVAGDERCGVSDEYLPATGVANNDVFWVTVEGPTEVAHALSGTEVAVGDRLTAITAATSGATTAGRVKPTAYSGAASTNLGESGHGVIGVACSAGATTGGNVLAIVKCGV
jgi:hypothetical protein